VLIATAAVALGLGLVTIPMHRASAAPPSGQAELIINKGGDRTGSQTVGGLPGAVFDFIAGTQGTVPAAGATPTASCTTTAAGTCHVDVAPLTGGSGNSTQGYWIRERTAPAGFSIAQVLDTGTNANNSSPNQYNPLFTGKVAANTTTNFPVAGTGSDQNSRGSSWADIRDNPALPGHCGLNIAMLFDVSGSIGSAISTIKTAGNGFVDALTGTPSQIALYSFSTNAQQLLTSTAVSTTAGANTVKTKINALPTPSGSTNWDQGLFQIAANPTPYDAVVMLTDGNPTVYGPPPATGPGSHTRFREVENGIFSANALKAEGTRVIAVGVGSGVTGATDNLKAISGPVTNSDYFQTDYAQLAALFRQIALETCQGTISVVKQVIPPRGTPAQATPAGGWTFSSSTSGVTPASGETDPATGGISFTAPLNGATSLPVTIDETQQSGFTLRQISGQNATCTDSHNAPVTSTNSGTLGFTVDAKADDAITCTVYNQSPIPPASVVVNKVWDIDGTTFPNGSQPTAFQAHLSLTGQTDPNFGTTFTGYQQGDSVTVGETVDTDLLPPGCTAGTPTGDIGDHTLAAGLNTYSITNPVTCTTTLTLLKHVINPYGTPADPNSWTLTASQDGGSQTFHGTTGVKDDITAGDLYNLSESDVPGYKQEIVNGAILPKGDTGSWHCVLRLKDGSTGPEFDGLNGGVTVGLGQNAECTANNIAQKATLTLQKTVLNTHGGTAVPTDWDLTATPLNTDTGAMPITGKDGGSTVTDASVVPLVGYTLTEANGPADYLPVGDPVCVVTGTTTPADMSGDVVTPALGQDVTCTFTNQDQMAPPTSPPPTSPPPTSPPPTSSPPTSPPPLPPTGTSFGITAAGGFGTLAVGIGLLVFALRRRRRLVDY
jgi:hypothetical protein